MESPKAGFLTFTREFNVIILGAGMSGCIAAILNSNASILEASDIPPTNHNAVLRFRTDAISKVTGIQFKKVEVNKAIYFDGKTVNGANPLTANLYSKKVTGKILSRSIWNLEPVQRFIAPKDFHSQLLDRIGNRVHYGNKITKITADSIESSGHLGELIRANVPIISTLPMPVMAMAAGMHLDSSLFGRMPIVTARCAVEDCNVNQTIYYPGVDTLLYRATLTGGELILEFAGDTVDAQQADEAILSHVLPAFGLCYSDVGPLSIGTQQYGKIAPVDDVVRKALMFEATRLFGVFSLGRFAIWKNILLDDVYDDVFQIRRMIGQSHYDIHREMSK